MSHLVFARKYRPQTFASLFGQEPIVTTLQNAIRTSRIAHAFLFTGPQGVGKTSAARLLSKALNCVSGPAAEPCNACPPCLDITAGQDIDVIEIDGASNRGIDEAREIRENVKYRPTRDRFKIYIIDEVHMLTTQAFNALLKTIEEPPPHVKFIAATTHPHALPVTFHSRCQRFDFRRVPPGVVSRKLQEIGTEEKLKYPAEIYRYLAERGQGSFRDTETLLEKVVAFGGKEVTLPQAVEILGGIDPAQVESFLTAVHEGNPASLLRLLEDLYTSGREPVEFLRELVFFVRDMLRLHALSESDRQGLAPDLAFFSRKLHWSQAFSLPSLLYLADTLFSLEERLRRSPHPRIHLELTFVKLARLRDLQSLPEILSRLETLGPGSPSLMTTPAPTAIPATSIRPLAPTPVTPPRPPPPQAPGTLSSSAQKPPVPPTRAPATPNTPDDVTVFTDLKQRWPEILQAVKKARPVIGSLLVEGEPLDADERQITLAFAPAHKFHREQLEQPAHRKCVEEIFREFLGRPLALVVTTRSNGEEEAPAARPQPGRPEDEPAVRKIMQLFNGRLVNIEKKE